MCTSSPESEQHLFFDCTKATKDWDASSLLDDIQAGRVNAGNFRDYFFNLLAPFSKEKRKVFAMMFWAMWRRNDMVWDNVPTNVQVAVRKFMGLLNSWLVVRARGGERELSVQPHQIEELRWQRDLCMSPSNAMWMQLSSTMRISIGSVCV